MSSRKLDQFGLQNIIQSILLLCGMLTILTVIGYVFAGTAGVIFSLGLGVATFLFSPRLSPRWLLSMYRAEYISPQASPLLYQMLDDLQNEAGLSVRPELYYLHSQSINSFTMGNSNNAHIVLTDGLLRSLNSREIFAVLAHELSHIVNKDIHVMTFADIISRITSMLATFGMIMLIINLPLLLLSNIDIPLLMIFVLIFAPNVSALFQLALSRTREFSADQTAVNLTGDPLGLITALKKIDAMEKNWLQQIIWPNYKTSEPSILRTHPATEERIARLTEILKIQNKDSNRWQDSSFDHDRPIPPDQRRRYHGYWF